MLSIEEHRSFLFLLPSKDKLIYPYVNNSWLFWALINDSEANFTQNPVTGKTGTLLLSLSVASCRSPQILFQAWAWIL